jgi:uncharacterized protein YbcI
MPDTDDQHPSHGKHMAISNLVVRLTREYTGRGPTRARTHISDDLVSVVMSDTLTKGEITLVQIGESERVLDMRKAFQRAMRQEMVSGVEEITGRTVTAFMSDNHIEPDYAVETFVLAPMPRPASG